MNNHKIKRKYRFTNKKYKKKITIKNQKKKKNNNNNNKINKIILIKISNKFKIILKIKIKTHYYKWKII